MGTSLHIYSPQSPANILYSPGSGQTIKHFTPSQITKIYGIEPNTHLHPALHAEIARLGLQDKYIVLPIGVTGTAANAAELASYGLTPNSVDSVVVCKVLCSVPQPRDVARGLYALLKKGGSMIVFEHVKVDDRRGSLLAKVLQKVYGVVWPHLMAGCELDRPTGEWLKEAGEWEKVELEGLKGEMGFETIPHVLGRLVK